MSESGGQTAVFNGGAGTGTPVSGDSGNLVAAAGTATLPGVLGKTTVMDGLVITGLGATAASTAIATVTGGVNTVNFAFTIPAGVATEIGGLRLTFPVPIPAAAQNTALVLNVPSFGAGNTNARGTCHGRQI
jgi:hypothetical protein